MTISVRFSNEQSPLYLDFNTQVVKQWHLPDVCGLRSNRSTYRFESLTFLTLQHFVRNNSPVDYLSSVEYGYINKIIIKKKNTFACLLARCSDIMVFVIILSFFLYFTCFTVLKQKYFSQKLKRDCTNNKVSYKFCALRNY